ncbi:MAG: AtpZ/AtpI family protein [Oscillospiraceae bacterium]|nr:AtpZ/AtpI family protein [Oscillospiraceae bacterium]
MNKRDNPMSAYIVASHIAFVVITPLLLFIGGGAWLCDKLSLPDWTKLLMVLVGVAVMILSLISYLMRLIKMYDGDSKGVEKQKPAFKGESDYYYENDIEP